MLEFLPERKDLMMANIMEKKRVMIIAHFCDAGSENSNNRFNYIANMMANTGYDVELVTSSFCHRDKRQREKVPEGMFDYKTTLIYEPSYKRNVSLKRLFISHRVMAENLEKYLKTCSKPDLIYCAIPSINVAEVASRYAEKNNIPFVIDVQDLWPEAYRLVIKNEKAYCLITSYMKKRVDKVYASADEIVAVSDTYASRAKSVNSKCKNATTVYLGTDLQVFDRNANKEAFTKKKDDEIWIAYCGTLGKSYDIKCVIDALDKIQNPKLKLIVMGDGPQREEFEQYAIEKSAQVIFCGKLPYEKMCALLTKCDITVNPIIGSSAASIINKHGDYAMSALPVINTQESIEYCGLIQQYNMGMNCRNGDADDIAEKLQYLMDHSIERKQMGLNARKCAENCFDRKETYLKIKDLIDRKINGK